MPWNGNHTGPDKPNKGRRNGACNRSKCQEEPATWYNRGSLAWYCGSCARTLNTDPCNRREAQRLFGGLLCVPAEDEDDGCPKGDPDCEGNNGDCHDACTTFAERGEA